MPLEAPSAFLISMRWQSGIAATAFLAGTILQGLLVLDYPSYSYDRWQGTLLVIAITLFSLLFNVLLGRRLALAETITLFLHVLGFIATLWAPVPKSNVYNTSSVVFTQFTDRGGWGNKGLSCLIGMLSPVVAFLGMYEARGKRYYPIADVSSRAVCHDLNTIAIAGVRNSSY
jgi:choline transport protein